MGCCNTCEVVTTKIILVFFNSIFFVCGVTTLAAGIWFLVDPYVLAYLDIANLGGDGDLATIAAYTTIGIGGLMTFVSFFGCLGACCNNHCMLYTYAISLVFVIFGQIAIATMALINRSWVNDTLERSMQIFVQEEYLGAEENEISKSWDHTQISFECCGAVSRDDYNGSRWIDEKAEPDWLWPRTCCVLSNTDPLAPEVVDEAGCKAGNTTAMHTQGCYEPLGEWLDVWGVALAGSVIGFALLQMVMVGLACCMINALHTYSVGTFA
eukprot:GHVN01046120.1.p1 GENE.GHVN01046120.1~~GHVN01046120.1.p1  ORF type:complete len:268 (+),score=2.44 GHVN01046120.1:258-1061(+)